jgi:hypothetical protein
MVKELTRTNQAKGGSMSANLKLGGPRPPTGKKETSTHQWVITTHLSIIIQAHRAWTTKGAVKVELELITKDFKTTS